MKKTLIKHALLAIFIAAFGILITFTIALDGYPNDNREKAVIFLIGYIGLFSSLYVTIVSNSSKRQETKTKTVIGSSLLDLEIKLNEELEAMKNETIVSVQVIDKLSALIVYRTIMDHNRVRHRST